MIYTNTKLNNTYCRYHRYGSDHRHRFTRKWIKRDTFIVPISSSGLGMENRFKTFCGIIGYYKTR